MEKKSLLVRFKEKMQSVRAKDIMSTEIIAVQEDMRFADLAKLMLERRISGAPVIKKDGKMAGIITTTNLQEAMFLIKKSGEVFENAMETIMNPKVDFFATKNTFCIKEDTSLEEMIDIMEERNIHTLPVMGNDKLVGIVGRHDIFMSFYKILQELCPY